MITIHGKQKPKFFLEMNFGFLLQQKIEQGLFLFWKHKYIFAE